MKPKEIKTCPFCEENTVTLQQKKMKHIHNGKLTEGNYWVYQCLTCQEEFTSTESDTISQKTWKHKTL